jgi:hypothetical protein
MYGVCVVAIIGDTKKLIDVYVRTCVRSSMGFGMIFLS